MFLQALTAYEGKIPDSLPAAQIGFYVRDTLEVSNVEIDDVVALAQRLNILAPDLIGIDGTDIVVNASATRPSETIAIQLDKTARLLIQRLMIRPIHPFPARMAPALAVAELGNLAPASVVFDPMSAATPFS